MGIGVFGVLGKSIIKALKVTGITVGSVAVIAAGGAMMDPTSMGAIWAATGPIGPIAIVVLSIVGQAVKDAVKHRDKI